MGNATWKRARMLSAAGLCLWGTACAGADAPPPGVDYGNGGSQRLYEEPLLPATSIAPSAVPTVPNPDSSGGVVPTPAGPADPIQPVASGGAGAGSALPDPGAGPSPSAGAAGSGASAIPGGAAGADATPGPEVAPGGPRPTMLTMAFTTVTQKGRYAPDNIGAAWVETAAGKWIHTLNFWANVPNGSHLNRYLGAGGADYGKFFGIATTPAPVDTVVTATLKQHGAHTGLSWNLKDANGTAIPDGDYKAVIELTEATSPGKFVEIPFTIGPSTTSPTPPTDQYFTGIQLTLQ